MNLSYYIDSADRREATDLLATGLFRGVTTNPAILEKAGLGSIDIPDVIRWATDAGAERVFVQAWGTSADDMVELGRQFRQISGNVVVKLPYSLEGIVAARRLAEDGEVLVTAVHADTQVLPIVLANATYLAPFVGRMDQAGRDGLDAALGMQRAPATARAGAPAGTGGRLPLHDGSRRLAPVLRGRRHAGRGVRLPAARHWHPGLAWPLRTTLAIQPTL
jgi:transaldolase